jgi:preprotein translocase subunit SecY
MSVWFSFLSGTTGSFANVAHFIALYTKEPTSSGGTSTTLVGGLVYLISPNFPLPYSSPYGIGGYGPYVSYLLTGTSQLYLPWGGLVYVPEWVHIITYTLVLVILCVIFGRFWVEMTGQSPKNVSEQLQEVGWQIPGFRRDPRIIESVLNKYIPAITILGSIFVGLLAALATLTGAIGSGMGVLLTVGIMYMLYQQLQRDRMLEGIPALDNFLSN